MVVTFSCKVFSIATSFCKEMTRQVMIRNDVVDDNDDVVDDFDDNDVDDSDDDD